MGPAIPSLTTKQVIVIRRDLKMRRGKECSQAAHAVMKVFFDRANFDSGFREVPAAPGHRAGYMTGRPKMTVPMTHEMMEWAQGTFTKITCQVASEEELLAVHRAALAAGLPVALVQDAGKTEFHGVPTYTCLAVGPANAKDVDEVTGHLKLY